MADVFISYAREDQPFVRRLHNALAAIGRETWVDWEGIPPSALWMEEVRAAIDSADAVVFVVSRRSVESAVCREEVEHAAAANKRLVPIVREEVDGRPVPPAVAAHNWIFFRDQDDFDRAFDDLVKAIEMDQEWVHDHTRLLVRAKEWESKGRPRSLVLRGEDLKDAEAWLAGAAGKNPEPTQLQTEYVLASRKAATGRQRVVIAGVGIALVISILLSIFALVQRSQAIRQRKDAVARQFASASNALLSEDTRAALRDAIRAFASERIPETRAALRRAVLADNTKLVIRPESHRYSSLGFGPESGTREIATVESVASVPGRNVLYSGGGDGVVASWRPSTGALISILGDEQGWVTGLAVGRSGRLFAAGRAGKPGIVGPRYGFLSMFSPDGHKLDETHLPADVYTVAVSPDARTVATAGRSPIVQIWRVTGSTIIHVRDLSPIPRSGAQLQVYALAFDPRGHSLAVGTAGGLIRVYDTRSGALIAKPGSHAAAVTDIAYTPDGQTLITVGADRLAKLWDTNSWRLSEILPHPVRIRAVAVSDSGDLAATVDNVGVGRVWDLRTGEVVGMLVGHRKWATDVAFLGNRVVATSSADGTLRIWSVGRGAPLASHATGEASSPNAVLVRNDEVLSAGELGTTMWNWRENRVVRTFKNDRNGRFPNAIGSEGGPWVVTYQGQKAIAWLLGDVESHPLRSVTPGVSWTGGASAPNGRTLLFGGSGGGFIVVGQSSGIGGGASLAVVYDTAAGRVITSIDPMVPIDAAALSPNGAMAATASWSEGSIRVWEASSRRTIATLETGQASDELKGALTFSSDGRYLLTSGTRGEVLIWSLAGLGEDGRRPSPSRQIETPHPAITGLSLSRDDRFLATAGVDGIVRIWDLSGPATQVMQFVAGSSQSGLNTEKFAQPDAFTSVSVSFGPDDHHVVTQTGDGLVRVYDCSLCVSDSKLMEMARSEQRG